MADTIIKDPKKYAAIYARISGPNDNNSLSGQIEQCRIKSKREELLVYKTYSEKISAASTPPQDRPTFKKLMEDAESGCFKTLIVNKHDRIVRNLIDWLQLKKYMKSLGIRIIFANETEFYSNGSAEGEFLENILITIAELEPDTTADRTSTGRAIRRAQGIYNSGKYVPFGYFASDDYNSSDNFANIKTYYNKNSLEAAFVEYIYNIYYFRYVASNDNTNLNTSVFNELREVCSIINSSNNLDNGRINIDNNIYPHIDILIRAINMEILQTSPNETKSKITTICDHLNARTNFEHIIKSPVYGKLMLKDAKIKNDSSKLFKQTSNGLVLNNENFLECANVDRILSEDLWFSVANSTLIPVEKEVVTPFIFSGLLRCGSCNTNLNPHDTLLCCSGYINKNNPNCNAYGISNLTSHILDILLCDLFKNNSSGFSKFEAITDNKLKKCIAQYEKLKKTKYERTLLYLKSSNNSNKERLIDLQSEIDNVLENIQYYRNRINTINTLKQCCDLNNSTFSLAKDKLIKHIIINYPHFNKLFKNIIYRIQVKTDVSRHSTKTTITYRD